MFVLVLPDAVDEAAQTIFSKLGSGISLIQTKQLKLTGASPFAAHCTRKSIFFDNIYVLTPRGRVLTRVQTRLNAAFQHTAQKAKLLLQKCSKAAIISAASNAMCVGVEIAGEGCIAAVQAAVAAAGGDAKAYVSAVMCLSLHANVLGCVTLLTFGFACVDFATT